MILTKGSLEEREQMDTSVLKAVPLFKDIDAEDLEALGQLMSETTLKRGDSLFREGDDGDRLYIVTDGKVKLSHSSDDGRENLIAVLGPGEIIGELSLFDLGARSSTVAAIAPTRLVSLSHKDMMSFINQHPDMAITMLRELARRLRNTNEQMADLVFSDVPGRVAKALIDLANRFGERTPEGIKKSSPTWWAPPGKPSTSLWPTSSPAGGSASKAAQCSSSNWRASSAGPTEPAHRPPATSGSRRPGPSADDSPE